MKQPANLQLAPRCERVRKLTEFGKESAVISGGLIPAIWPSLRNVPSFSAFISLPLAMFALLSRDKELTTLDIISESSSQLLLGNIINISSSIRQVWQRWLVDVASSSSLPQHITESEEIRQQLTQRERTPSEISRLREESKLLRGRLGQHGISTQDQAGFPWCVLRLQSQTWGGKLQTQARCVLLVASRGRNVETLDAHSGRQSQSPRKNWPHNKLCNQCGRLEGTGHITNYVTSPVASKELAT
uniref:Uncharacterized protein n=1 Tax=Timema monikensis TaxID=170555 RepID=A0A7R9E9R1_9NEOP|nr:unnamed protein product [Timema monikensis]